MNIIVEAVIPVNNRVRYDFMDCRSWILNLLKPTLAEHWYVFDKFFCFPHSLPYLLICISLNR